MKQPISRVLKRKLFPKDVHIARQGDDADCAYLIQTGKVRIYQINGGKEYDLATVGAGEIIGEMALFVNMKRTAHMIAMDDTIAIVISPKMMNQKLAKTDPTIRAIVSMLSKRLIKLNKDMIDQKDTFQDIQKTVTGLTDKILDSVPDDQPDDYKDALRSIIEQEVGEAAKTIASLGSEIKKTINQDVP